MMSICFDRRGTARRAVSRCGLILLAWFCSIGSPAYGQPQTPESWRFGPVSTLDVPAHTVEIVQADLRRGLLLATNPQWKSVDIYEIESLEPLRLRMIDFDPEDEPGPQGVGTIYEPTSVALHPTRPIALVAVLGRSLESPGHLLAIDLRPGERTLGRWIMRQEVGFHPDAVAVSPDGRWAIVACEGEASPVTPGELWVIDLEGLTADRKMKDGDLPAYNLAGLAKLMQTPAGVLEPEVVAFDPRSRFAVATLQENDSFVTIDLSHGSEPRLTSRTYLAQWAEPDGIDVIDGVRGPDGRDGCLVAVAEEGTFNEYGQIRGNEVSFYWLDPRALDEPAVLRSRNDVRPWVNPKALDRRRDPESVKLLRLGGRVLAIVTIERGDDLLLLDVTDATRPVLLDTTEVGDRPEGLTLLKDERGVWVVTGDEGNWGPGTVSITRLRSE